MQVTHESMPCLKSTCRPDVCRWRQAQGQQCGQVDHLVWHLVSRRSIEIHNALNQPVISTCCILYLLPPPPTAWTQLSLHPHFSEDAGNGWQKKRWGMNLTLSEAQWTQELTQWLEINSTTTWQHLLKFQIWPSDGTTCISCKLGGTTCVGSKFGHQLVPLALLPKLATTLRYLHCYIALDCPIGIIS